MACRLESTKPLSESMLSYCQLDHKEQTLNSEILIGIQIFSFKKMHLKLSSAKWRPVCLGLNVLNLDFMLWNTNTWNWRINRKNHRNTSSRKYLLMEIPPRPRMVQTCLLFCIGWKPSAFQGHFEAAFSQNLSLSMKLWGTCVSGLDPDATDLVINRLLWSQQYILPID